MARETVLITGASVGIGRELARLFAADGASLVLVARRGDELEALAGELARAHGTDAFQPGPRMAAHYATKAYVLSLTEALAEELRGTGVTVTCLAPGPTDTEFATVAGRRSAAMTGLGAMRADAVARAGHDGFRRGRVLVVPGWRDRFVTAIVRLAPRAAVRRVVAAMNT